MKKTLACLSMILILAAAAALPVRAGEESQQAKTPLRTEIVKLRYVQAEAVRTLLYPYLSRDGGMISDNGAPHILTISDHSENVEKILAAVRTLDVKRGDVLLTVQLVLGSQEAGRTDPELQNDPTVKELRKLLKYNSYSLLDSNFVRCESDERAELILGKNADFKIYLRPEVIRETPTDLIKVYIQLTQSVTEITEHEAKHSDKPVIQSAVNIKSGDRTVVGVSRLDGGDTGLVLIITAKVVD